MQNTQIDKIWLSIRYHIVKLHPRHAKQQISSHLIASTFRIRWISQQGWQKFSNVYFNVRPLFLVLSVSFTIPPLSLSLSLSLTHTHITCYRTHTNSFPVFHFPPLSPAHRALLSLSLSLTFSHALTHAHFISLMSTFSEKKLSLTLETLRSKMIFWFEKKRSKIESKMNFSLASLK